jgi:hypothetical protein
MRYPISKSQVKNGLKGDFGNPLEEVAQILNQKHGKKYWIMNLSEYDYDKDHDRLFKK